MDAVSYLVNGIIIALIVLLIWQTFQEGHIFDWTVNKFHLDELPDKLQKPIYSCPICMTPYYGTGIWFLLLDGHGFVSWITSIFVAAGINTIVAHHFIHDE